MQEKSISNDNTKSRKRKTTSSANRINQNFKPIIGCKHPIIASGATPIGSVERTSDKKNIR
jgi:hypothetical protein